MSDDFVKAYELEWLQQQIYDLRAEIVALQNNVEQLEQENTLLKNDVNTIKMEGCYRFVEDANHKHKSKNE